MTDGNKPENEPVSDFLTRAEERAGSDKKTRHEATHAATRPKRADERQERRRKDTARPPHQPKTAQSGRRHQDARRRQAETVRRTRTDTTRTRSHITNGGGYVRTQERNACSYAHRISYYIYIYTVTALYYALIYYILFIAFSSCCLYGALCARVILPRLCIFMQYLCIFIYKASIYRYFIQFLFIMQSLCKVATSYCLYYIYTIRATP